MDLRATSDFVRPCPSCAAGTGYPTHVLFGWDQRILDFRCGACGHQWQQRAPARLSRSVECLERSATALRNTRDAIDRARTAGNTAHDAKRRARLYLG